MEPNDATRKWNNSWQKRNFSLFFDILLYEKLKSKSEFSLCEFIDVMIEEWLPNVFIFEDEKFFISILIFASFITIFDSMFPFIWCHIFYFFLTLREQNIFSTYDFCFICRRFRQVIRISCLFLSSFPSIRSLFVSKAISFFFIVFSHLFLRLALLERTCL